MERLAPTATPIVIDDINDLSLLNNTNETINLSDHFDDPFTTGQVARFELYDTSQGTGVTEVLLFDQEDEGAPLAAGNFINYVTDGDYVDTIIHRSVPGFIIQGGGFEVDGLADVVATNAGSAVTPVPTDPPIQNEFSATRSNLLGTIALAKLGGDPNSATSQFFFNLNDNSGNLDSQNGGFTVFGEVLGSADLEVLEAIADLPISNETTLFNQTAFTDLPLIVDDPANPVINGDENLVRYRDISVAQRDELEFEVVSNSNPAVVTLNLSGGNLQLESQATSGSSTITVRATNLVGAVIEDTFTVTVSDTPPADEAPTTTGITDITVEEDSDNTIVNLFDAFSDREDDDSELTYAVISNSNAALFTSAEINATNGELTLDYAPGQNGQADITVEATDTNNQTVSSTFSVTVNAGNASPVATSDVFNTTSSDGPLVVSAANGVLSNDTDGDGDTLIANLESDPINGAIQLNTDGSFTYTPEAGFSGFDFFSYTANDGTSDSSPTNVSIQVNALPTAPDNAIQGSDTSNSLKGSSGSDYLLGLGENDRLRGRKGDDTLDGGAGDDRIKGHRGNDLIDGGADNDTVRAGRGNDTVFGGAGLDFLKGQKGHDILTGGDGNDLLHGEKGNDLLIGGNQDDYIRGGKGNDTLIGGSGNDTLRGNSGDDLYVLSQDGVDEFEKFKIGQDLIGLADGITFGALTFESNGNTTEILFEDTLIANVHQKNSGNLANQANFIEYP